MGEMLPAITHNLQRQKQNIAKLMKRLGKKQAAQIIQTRNLKMSKQQCINANQ